jgi:hypothetical protein
VYIIKVFYCLCKQCRLTDLALCKGLGFRVRAIHLEYKLHLDRIYIMHLNKSENTYNSLLPVH